MHPPPRKKISLSASLALVLLALAAAGCQPHYPQTSDGPTPLGDVIVKTKPTDTPNQVP